MNVIETIKKNKVVWIETYELCQKLKGLSYVACSGAAYSLFLTVDEGVQPLKTRGPNLQCCNAQQSVWEKISLLEMKATGAENCPVSIV